MKKRIRFFYKSVNGKLYTRFGRYIENDKIMSDSGVLYHTYEIKIETTKEERERRIDELLE